jgi:exosome complex component RRP4
MIKEMTNTQIVVGQNGIVWVKGDHEDIAMDIVTTIEKKSHVHGLTEHIKSLLEEKMKHFPKPVKRFVEEDREDRGGGSEYSDSFGG